LVVLISCSLFWVIFSHAISDKIIFDTTHLDSNGLDRNGKHISYEYCISTQDNRYPDIVKHIDPTAKCEANKPGKIGCNVDTELLCVGMTYQPEWTWKIALAKFSSMPFIDRVEERPQD